MSTVKEYTIEQLKGVEKYLDSKNVLVNLESLENDRNIIDKIERAVQGVDMFTTKNWSNHYQLGFYRILLFCISKSYCSSDGYAVETGVLHGMSSAYILEAIKQKQSHLISIDLPSYEDNIANTDGYNSWLPTGKSAGWMLDSEDSDWSLKLGDTRDLLPRVLKENSISVFVHDSDHSYDHMWFEMETAYSLLDAGSIIIVDNIEHSNCFEDFLEKKNIDGLLLDHFAGQPNDLLELTNRKIGLIRT